MHCLHGMLGAPGLVVPSAAKRSHQLSSDSRQRSDDAGWRTRAFRWPAGPLASGWRGDNRQTRRCSGGGGASRQPALALERCSSTWHRARFPASHAFRRFHRLPCSTRQSDAEAPCFIGSLLSPRSRNAQRADGRATATTARQGTAPPFMCGGWSVSRCAQPAAQTANSSKASMCAGPNFGSWNRRNAQL